MSMGRSSVILKLWKKNKILILFKLVSWFKPQKFLEIIENWLSIPSYWSWQVHILHLHFNFVDTSYQTINSQNFQWSYNGKIAKKIDFEFKGTETDRCTFFTWTLIWLTPVNYQLIDTQYFQRSNHQSVLFIK